MSKEPPKRGAAPDPEPVRVTRNPSGRVTFDERGNAVWQWAVPGELASDGATARLEKLADSALALAEDAPPPSATVKSNPKGVVQGYSPYDSGLLEKPTAARRKTDLRRLGEYFKLRRQVSAHKRDEE